MREKKNCAWCGEEFITYQKSATCSHDCYLQNRKKNGWFKKEFKKTTNCFSASRSLISNGKGKTWTPQGEG